MCALEDPKPGGHVGPWGMPHDTTSGKGLKEEGEKNANLKDLRVLRASPNQEEMWERKEATSLTALNKAAE